MGVILLQEIMEKRFHEIRENFKRASAKNDMVFSDDVFIDTYITCCEHLKNNNMNESQIIQYFWVSFTNNIKLSSAILPLLIRSASTSLRAAEAIFKTSSSL